MCSTAIVVDVEVDVEENFTSEAFSVLLTASTNSLSPTLYPDVASVMTLVRKYEHITALTPDLVHELIERIEIHAPDKSSGHREQKVDIYFRFRVAVASAVISRKGYGKGKQAA